MAKYIIPLFLLLAACGQNGPVAINGVPLPIITPTQSWEGNNIEDGSVVRVDSVYYRFYCAGDGPMSIGFATATQFPTQWQKYENNPIIQVTDVYPSAVNGAVCAPRLIAMPDGSFRMYTHAFDGTHDRVFLFTASRESFPTSWTLANNGQPILSESPTGWDSYQVQSQIIIPSWDAPDNQWHMFYIGYDRSTYRGGHATSPDGIVWQKDPANPVMSPTSGWIAQHVGPLSWYKSGSTYYLLAQGFDGSRWSVGFYTTTDLFNLQAESIPLLSGTPYTWTSSGIEGADIFNDDGSLWLFYLGSDAQNSVSGGTQYRAGVTQI